LDCRLSPLRLEGIGCEQGE